MNVLYKESKKIIHTFTINEGGELNIRVGGYGLNVDLSITFEDGKFVECRFPFTGTYERQHWHIFEAVNKKITELEEYYYQ